MSVPSIRANFADKLSVADEWEGSKEGRRVDAVNEIEEVKKTKYRRWRNWGGMVGGGSVGVGVFKG